MDQILSDFFIRCVSPVLAAVRVFLHPKQPDYSVFIEIAQQGQTDRETEQAQNTEKLRAYKHAGQGDNRVKPNLGADDFGSMIFLTTVTKR